MLKERASRIIDPGQQLSEDQAVALLQSRRPDDVAVAARSLGNSEAAAAVRPLIEAYDRLDADGPKLDKWCSARRAIVEALGKIGAAIAEPVVRRALYTSVGGGEDATIELRATAALAIAQVDPGSAIHDLALLLFDEKPHVAVASSEFKFSRAAIRMAAAQALSALGDSAAAALLAVKLRYAGSEVSEVLAQYLESFCFLRPPNVFEVAGDYLAHRDPFLAGSAAAALARHCGEEALDLLVESASDMPRQCIVPLVLLITGIRSHRTGEALATFLGDRDPNVRLAAVQGATLYPSQAVKERLTSVAKSDPDPNVRDAARAATL